MQHYEGKVKPVESAVAVPGAEGVDARKSINSDNYHIAFGTKMSGQRKPKEVSYNDTHPTPYRVKIILGLFLL